MLVTGAMNVKRKIGGGKVKNSSSVFNKSVKEAKNAIRNSKPKGVLEASKIALTAARKTIRKSKKKNIKPKRILPIPKRGGVLPFLVPIFAGLSAAGGIAGGAAAVAKAVNDAKSARNTLEEQKRHNQKIEAIALKGKGFYLKPYKKGYGIFNSKN
jgi:hypothetical protein